MISYEPLYKTLKRRNISQYKLVNSYFISPSILNRIRNEKPISLSSVEILCKILHCEIQDIVKIF